MLGPVLAGPEATELDPCWIGRGAGFLALRGASWPLSTPQLFVNRNIYIYISQQDDHDQDVHLSGCRETIMNSQIAGRGIPL